MKQTELVLNELTTMGFEPVELGDLGYIFQYEEVNYLYMPDDEDEYFLRIVIPGIFDITDENRVAALEAMHETELIMKYAKMCIMMQDTVWAVYEHRLNSSDNLTEMLEHIIRVLDATVNVFNMKINGEEVVLRSDESEDDSLEADLRKLLEGVDEQEIEN